MAIADFFNHLIYETILLVPDRKYPYYYFFVLLMLSQSEPTTRIKSTRLCIILVNKNQMPKLAIYLQLLSNHTLIKRHIHRVIECSPIYELQ